jgi:hypothetical protein
VYPVPAVVAVTGLAPVTGAVTPAMAGDEIVLNVGVGVGTGTGSETGTGTGTGTGSETGTGTGTGTGRGTGAGTGIGIGARAGLDEIEAGDEPLPLIAITEKEYVFPGIRLEIFAALI